MSIDMSKFDKDEQEIYAAFSSIRVSSEGLIGRVNGKLHSQSQTQSNTHNQSNANNQSNAYQQYTQQNQGRKGASRTKRGITLAAAVVLIMALSTTVFAFAFGGLDWFIARFAPAHGGIVQQVMAYSEDQGIRMTVIGAQRFGNMAVVYFSVQDVSGENRLRESMDFRDGFSALLGEPDSGISAFTRSGSMLYFDESTNSAYFEVIIIADANSPLSDPLTIGSTLLAFESSRFELEPIAITLSDLAEGKTIAIKPYDHIFSQNITAGSDIFPEPEQILSPGRYMPMPNGETDLWISNAGIVDGQLHVQVIQYFDIEFGSNNPAFSLIAPDGQVTDFSHSVTVLLDEGLGLFNFREFLLSPGQIALPPYRLTEVVFDVDISDLRNYTLAFTGTVAHGIQGYWMVEVNTSDTANQMIALANIYNSNLLFEFITLSPLGLQITGYSTAEVNQGMEAVIETTDGTISLGIGGGSFGAVVELGADGLISAERNTFRINWGSGSPLDISSVTAIVIDGFRIPVA